MPPLRVEGLVSLQSRTSGEFRLYLKRGKAGRTDPLRKKWEENTTRSSLPWKEQSLQSESCVPEDRQEFHNAVRLQGSVRGHRRLVRNWQSVFTHYLACEANEREAYLSVFTYGSAFLTHYVRQKSNALYTGPACGHFLHLDFDNETDPDRAIDEAQTVLSRCEALGADLDEVIACFSGNKGAHLYFPLPRCAQPSVHFGKFCKSIVATLTEGCESADVGIYDHQRIFRLPNTRHPKSGKLKVPYRAADFVELDPL